MKRFREQLKAKQGTEYDRDFAARLGVSRAHWTRLKLGKRPFTLTILSAAIRLWPDLGPVYLEDVRDTGTPPDQA